MVVIIMMTMMVMTIREKAEVIISKFSVLKNRTIGAFLDPTYLASLPSVLSTCKLIVPTCACLLSMQHFPASMVLTTHPGSDCPKVDQMLLASRLGFIGWFFSSGMELDTPVSCGIPGSDIRQPPHGSSHLCGVQDKSLAHSLI